MSDKTKEAPDPRGYVFVDCDGDAWGWDETGRAPESTARRPFRTAVQARRAGNKCSFGCCEVRVWRTTDRVPPMPETARLIAAAPELLSALQRLRWNFDLILSRKPCRDVAECRAEVDAAITKATGEKQ